MSLSIRHVVTMLMSLATCLAFGLPSARAAILPEVAVPQDPCGGVDSYTTWSSATKPWVVTHATRYEHYTTGADTRTYTASEQAQLTASVTYSVKGSMSANAVIGSLGAEVNLALAVSGQKTVSTSVSVTSTMNDYAAYVFYRGDHKASGSFTNYVCGPTGHGFVVNSVGSASSWDVYTAGALHCTTSPPSTSLGYVVKPRFC